VSHAADDAAPREFLPLLGGPLSQLLLRPGILRPPLDLLTRRVRLIIARQ